MDHPGDLESAAIEVENGSEPEKAEIKYEAPMSLAEATSYFESIVAGMRAGHMRVSHEGTTLTLEPRDSVEVAVKAVRKKGKEKISFEVEWRMAPVSGLQIESE
ncbi:MAG: amphi-Trp domain-containing protein [Candidatus Eisenbacteria bacterium]